MIKDSAQNIKSLERIESAIVCVALDDTSPVTRDEVSFVYISSYTPHSSESDILIFVSLVGISGQAMERTDSLINNNVCLHIL